MPCSIQVDLTRTFPRQFVPPDADMGDWAQVEPLFAELLRRQPATAEELERWLADRSEILTAFAEERNKRYVAMTSQTDDPVREAAYQKFVEELLPRFKPLVHALEKAYLASPSRRLLSASRYRVLDRNVENRVALFRKENVPLETEDDLLAKDYQKTVGAMTVMMNGAELTVQQAAKLLEEPDRALRQQIWERISGRYLQDKDVLDQIYDQFVALRTQIAANAGFSNYRDFMFRRLERFEYSHEDCFRFHDAVERAFPLLPVDQP